MWFIEFMTLFSKNYGNIAVTAGKVVHIIHTINPITYHIKFDTLWL